VQICHNGGGTKRIVPL